MESAETIFAIANTWILPGWLLLLFAPAWKYTGKIVFYVIIAVLAITYAWLLLSDIGSFDPEAGSTLANISNAFADPRVALIGWIHYLAFDMLAGLLLFEQTWLFSPWGLLWLLVALAYLFVLRYQSEMKTLQAEALRAAHLASLGELAAGVAHEINNPNSFIILRRDR